MAERGSSGGSGGGGGSSSSSFGNRGQEEDALAGSMLGVPGNANKENGLACGKNGWQRRCAKYRVSHGKDLGEASAAKVAAFDVHQTMLKA